MDPTRDRTKGVQEVQLLVIPRMLAHSNCGCATEA
jgi:hypothetical protein